MFPRSISARSGASRASSTPTRAPGRCLRPRDYCRIEPLGIDDFGEVERLLERGQAEGFLKIRGREEIGEILLCGYGARLGASHLAGVAALLDEPYAREGTAEIVALYTISRFKGEGVGGKLIARILGEAENRGLDSVFRLHDRTWSGAVLRARGLRPHFSRGGPGGEMEDL